MSTLTFLGAVGEVTGSRYLIEVDGDDDVIEPGASSASRRLLLECGMHQGGEEAERVNAEPFGRLAETLDEVVISHG
ncbi:MAG: hypothetical protein WCD50_15315, partial [Onishia taeanensis]